MCDFSSSARCKGILHCITLVSMLLLAGPGLAQKSVRPVKLVELVPQRSVEQRSLPGRVRARQTVDLAFQVAGQIVDFPAMEGGVTAEGDTVAALDRAKFERAIRQAQATFAQEEQNQARLARLSGNAVPRTEVEAANTQLELSRLAVEEAEANLDDATLESPFDALVASRLVAPFTTVQAGEPVVRLHDMSETLIDINVPEVLAGDTGDGNVSFTATFPGRDQTFPLSIWEYEAESADTGQTFRLTLRLEEGADAGILPGTSSMVIIRRESEIARTILLPHESLVYGADGEPHVLVFSASGEDVDSGTVALRPVEIRRRDDGRIALVDGVEEGVEIVAAGAALVEDGQSVRRFAGLGE